MNSDTPTPIAEQLPPEVVEAFAELERREARLREFRALRAKLDAAFEQSHPIVEYLEPPREQQ